MKNTITSKGRIVLTLLSFLLLLTPVGVFAQNISLNYKDVPLKVVLNKISEISNYKFVYTNNLDVDKIIVTAVFEEQDVKKVMSKMFSDNNISYSIKGKQIALAPIKPKPMAPVPAGDKQRVESDGKEGITIQGVVTDGSSGFSVPGASVKSKKNSKIITLTDLDGKYSITTAPDDILIFYSLGMKEVEIPINRRNTINIVLDEDIVKLDNIVVTGYQTLSKERATGSYSTITSKDLENKLQPSLQSMLEGNSAGVVTNNGKIEIRGVSTIQGVSTPLIVVDGYPLIGSGVGLETVNPDNIESITVLKDAVAASIYGARASNGVIVITTKKAKAGTFNASYKSVFGITSKLKISSLNLADVSDYIDAETDLFNYDPTSYLSSYNSWNRISDLQYTLLAKTNNWISAEEADSHIAALRKNNSLAEISKYMMRPETSQQHSINFSSGSDKNLFNGSLKYTKENGNLKYNDNTRLIADINNLWKPADWFTFRFLSSINYTKSNATKDNYSSFRMDPYTDLYDDNGEPIYYNPSGQRRIPEYDKYPRMKSLLYHPENELPLLWTKTENIQVRIGGDVTIKLCEGLTVSGGGSWIKGFNKSRTVCEADSYVMRSSFNDGTSRISSTTNYIPDGGRIDEGRGSIESWVLRGQLNYSKALSENRHRITAMLGSEMSKDTYETIAMPTYLGYNTKSQTVNTGFDIYAYNKNTGNIKGNMLFQKAPANLLGLSYGGTYTVRDSRFASWYANGSYEFLSKYLLSASTRLDLTNFFGTDPKYRYKPTWSVGSTYKISQEEYFEPLKGIINRLNLRASYGINGNISLSNFPYLVLSVGSYNEDADGISNGISAYPNNQLRWERTAIANFGMDISFLKDRINLTAEYYNKKSTDLIASDVIDYTRGVYTLSKNIGSLRNTGTEITVDAKVYENKDFRWNASIIWSHNKSKMLTYNGNLANVLNYTSGAYVPGYPMSGLWALKYSGLNNNGICQFINSKGDLTDAGGLMPNDAVYMGPSNPTDNLSLSNQLSYKNFDLSFMFIAKLGGYFRSDIFNGANINNRHVGERWKVPGDELTTIYPKLISGNYDQWYVPYADKFVCSSNYLKLREVTLSYNIPKLFVEKLGLSSVKAYFEARNLFRITAKGVDVDPEGISVLPQYYFGISVNL